MRALTMLVMLLGSALLSGCVGGQSWASKSAGANYREQVSSVLVSKDGKTLVVVGKNHHYIFDAPPAIVRTLTSDYQKYVSAAFGEFLVNDSQRIEGRYALHIRDDAPDQAKMSAWTSGFFRDPQGRVRAEGILSGKRYSAGNVKVEANARALNKEYFIDVRAPGSNPAGLAESAPLTPIVAAGALLLLYGVVLYAVPTALVMGFL